MIALHQGFSPSFYGKPAGNLLDTSSRSHSEVDTNFTISEPYAVLMHYFIQIEAVIQDAQSTKHQLSRLGAEHLNHLYDFLKPLYDDRVLPCQEQFDNPSPRVTFAMLWWIYKPGTSVHVRTSRVVYTCIIADPNDIEFMTEKPVLNIFHRCINAHSIVGQVESVANPL